MSRTGKPTEIEVKLPVAHGWRGWKGRDGSPKGNRVTLWDNENLLKLTMVVLVQL